MTGHGPTGMWYRSLFGYPEWTSHNRAHPNVVEPHRASTYDANAVIVILMGAFLYIQVCGYEQYYEC